MLVLQPEPVDLPAMVAYAGPGIPAELRPILFDRVHPRRPGPPPSEGSRLGLAITRENVRLHDGRVEASTEDGAMLTVTLPR